MLLSSIGLLVRTAFLWDKYCCLDLTLTTGQDLKKTDVMRKKRESRMKKGGEDRKKEEKREEK